MRTLTCLFSLLVFLFPGRTFADAYVHGSVKFANGVPVAYCAIYISGDSMVAGASCAQTHLRYTNAAGLYRDTLVCNTSMSRIRVSVLNCNGSRVVHDYNFTATQSLESNFVICDSALGVCNARFTWLQNAATTGFYSSTSSAAAITNDYIISRTWTFGDGTSLTGNVIDPVHIYSQLGSYNACLKIKTLSGCESSYCLPVLIGYNTCVDSFLIQRVDTTRRYRFNSTASSAAANDSIITRTWHFGDGDSLTGNVVNPEHTYAGFGYYTVCLTIKTVHGCEKTVCKQMELQNFATNCSANFTNAIGTTGNPYTTHFNSSYSTSSPGDSIVQRHWTFGDGTTGTGFDPTHTYLQPGTYQVCLTITTLYGCSTSYCKYINVGSARCEATFSDSATTLSGGNPALRYFRFNSINSHGAPASDSIASRRWTFGDGSSVLQGNQVSPVHGYTAGGTYTVLLSIRTASGCTDSVYHVVSVPASATNCQPRFTTMANALTVTFNSNTTTAAPGDSIISRVWNYGDGATSNTNAAVRTHQYTQAGLYNACLTIRTQMGCVATWCKQVAVVTVTGNCVPYFTKEQVAAPAKTIRFNSIAAYSQLPNDSIITRKWEFGDGQVLNGNVINPLHTYSVGGTYNVCLTIYTAHCDKRWCQTIQVLPMDSTNMTDSLSIVNLYPVPVSAQLNVVLYNSRPNVHAELAIYDVYGIRKWFQNTVLPHGNSTYATPTTGLAAGPYIFKVTTMYDIQSRNFYKVN